VHIIFTRYVCDLFAKLHGLIITYFAQETDSCFCGCVMGIISSSVWKDNGNVNHLFALNTVTA